MISPISSFNDLDKFFNNEGTTFTTFENLLDQEKPSEESLPSSYVPIFQMTVNNQIHVPMPSITGEEKISKKRPREETLETELKEFDTLTRNVDAFMKKQHLVTPIKCQPIAKEKEGSFTHLNRSSQREAIQNNVKKLISRGKKLDKLYSNQQTTIENLRKENEELRLFIDLQAQKAYEFRQIKIPQLESENQLLKESLQYLETERNDLILNLDKILNDFKNKRVDFKND